MDARLCLSILASAPIVGVVQSNLLSVRVVHPRRFGEDLLDSICYVSSSIEVTPCPVSPSVNVTLVLSLLTSM